MSRSTRKKSKQNEVNNPVYVYMSRAIFKGRDIAIKETAKKFNIDNETVNNWKTSKSIDDLMNKIKQEKV